MIPSKVQKYKFMSLGWHSRNDARILTQNLLVCNYSYVHREYRPSNEEHPHECSDLIYTGRAGGGKKLYRWNDKSGERWKATMTTHPRDRYDDHHKNMNRDTLEECTEAKYKWFHEQKLRYPKRQVWYHFYVPANSKLTMEALQKMLVPVCCIEMEIIELWNDQFGNAPPMNWSNRWDVDNEDPESFSSVFDSTTQNLDRFIV